MQRKTFKYRLYPNKTQEQKLYWTLTRCRELYNAALSERKDAYRYAHKNTTFNQQSNQLPEIKQIREEYQDIYGQVLQDVLRRVQRSMDNFFRRIKNGEKPGYPRFQGKNRYSSFTYPQMTKDNGPTFYGNKIRLPKIGHVKIKLHRSIEGKIKTVTIKHEVGQWYIYFACEVPDAEKLPVSYEDVGVDLGVSHLVTLSNGEMIEHPRYYRKGRKALEQRQRALSRKKKGSHRRDKAKRLVGKAHRKIKNQRKDFLHKASRELVDRYQVIVFEDIQVSNLTKKPKVKQDDTTGQYLPNGASAKGGLNKSILDAGWGMFLSMCSCKAEEAGRTLLTVNPQYTSQICSQCGTVRKKTLAERWHSCECGAELDRDVNAAINILERGMQCLNNQLVRTEPTLVTA